MRKKIIKFLLKTCHICHGIGTIEISGGDTLPCPACKGEGLL
jgi:DnaJ-class molecular chaperone